MAQDGSPAHSEANRSGRPKVPLQAVTRGSPQALVVSTEHRNPGTALKPEWFDSVQVNLSAVERRASTVGTRR